MYIEKYRRFNSKWSRVLTVVNKVSFDLVIKVRTMPPEETVSVSLYVEIVGSDAIWVSKVIKPSF